MPHTEGTWSVEQGINDFDIVVSCEGRATARLAGYIQREADADLIAAAPELLAASKAVLAQFAAGLFVRNTDSDGCSDWALKAAAPLRDLAALTQAIAKAEGLSIVAGSTHLPQS